MTACGNTKGASGMCANTAVSVILVRTYEEHARHFPLPKYWVLPTCTDCKPQFMAEYRDHDTITATIDTEPSTAERVAGMTPAQAAAMTPDEVRELLAESRAMGARVDATLARADAALAATAWAVNA